MPLSSEVFELLTRGSAPSAAPGGFLRLYTLRDGKVYTIDEHGVSTQVGGTVSFADGTVSAPGLYWTSDTNTGIWRPGSGTLGVAGDGVEVARFQAPGGVNPQVLIQNGSISKPALALNSAPSVGFYSPVAAAIALAIAGVDKMWWDATQMFMGNPCASTSLWSTPHHHQHRWRRQLDNQPSGRGFGGS